MSIKNILILFFKIIPKGLISRIFGRLALMPMPPFIMNSFIKHYSSFYNVNRDEIENRNEGFSNIDDFFTRKLKQGVHKIDDDKNSIVSPVDARVDQYGKINKTELIQAKGVQYSLKDLLPSGISNDFINGSFITLYLSPADYHRIHSPISGSIIGHFAVPGKLFPVQEFMVEGLKGLFAINERVFTYIKNGHGLAAVCKVGAMNVGKITLSYDNVAANKMIRRRRENIYPENMRIKIKKGEEIGIFHLGSTIVMLFQKNMINFDKIEIGKRVRVGERIASYV